MRDGPPGIDAPPRSAHIALAATSALCAQAPSRQAHADVASATPADQDQQASKWMVLALSGTATFMTTLDSSIVNIALPSIARAFGVPLAGTVEWVLIGYLVVVAAALLTLGRVADMVGRRPVFLGGLAIFTLSSAVCGAAPSLPLLIVARCIQGLGAAGIFATNVALITRAFPPAERGRALGANMVLVALGVSAGPTIGGILTEFFSWRAIFYVNVPIGAVVMLVAWRALPERHAGAPQRFDVLGATLIAVGLAGLTAALSFGSEWGWTSARFIFAIGIAAIALLATPLVERRQASPIVDLGLMRNRVFVLANVSFMLCMLALFAVGFLLPFYFEELRGFSTLRSGLLLTPLSLTLAVVAPLAGAIADRTRSRWLAPAGLAIACLGLVLLARLDATTSTLYLIASLVVVGLGQGIFQSPNSRAIMGAAPANEQGVASGTLATARVLGQSLSVALAGAVFTGLGGATAGASLVAVRASESPGSTGALDQTFVDALHAALLVCAAVAAIGVLTSLARGREASEPGPGRGA